MKIYIYDKDDNKTIKLYLPLFLLKSKIVTNLLNDSIDDDVNFKYLINSLNYKNIKQYIKNNGHFNLVEIKSSDGDIILIRI